MTSAPDPRVPLRTFTVGSRTVRIMQGVTGGLYAIADVPTVASWIPFSAGWSVDAIEQELRRLGAEEGW